MGLRQMCNCHLRQGEKNMDFSISQSIKNIVEMQQKLYWSQQPLQQKPSILYKSKKEHFLNAYIINFFQLRKTSSIIDSDSSFVVLGYNGVNRSPKMFSGQRVAYNNMILTAETINKAKHYINHENQKELDLRSLNITHISSLSATANYFEAIDLSNNLIRTFDNLSYLDRLRTLMLVNNRIASLERIGEYFPNLKNLFLMGNRIAQKAQLDNIASCRQLTNLNLTGNPLSEDLGYRKSVIVAIRWLSILDFKKVTQNEKKEAALALQN